MVSLHSGDHAANSNHREFAVILYLPERLEEVVTPLRERYDPDYNLVAAHVTIVFPFITARPLEELSEIVENVAMKTAPLTIELSSVGDFYPKTPIIYWDVKENAQLLQLSRRLYAQLDLPLIHKDYRPHVTIGREISYHRVVLVKDTIASYLPEESFETGSLDLISAIAGDRWVSVRTFPLIAV